MWCVDYKGQYPTSRANHWCYPLTITDSASRFLLGCHGVSSTKYIDAKPIFDRAFREFGLPQNILSDNGPPFASRAAGGLTRLSLSWVLLGINVHRIEPGKPTQNARHERMHKSLHAAIGRQMRSAHPVKQQELLTAFREEYNNLRSHEALKRKTPASCYSPSTRRYSPVIQPLLYDGDQIVRRVRQNGEIKLKGEKIYISEILAQLPIGLREIDNDLYEARIRDHLLGYVDLSKGHLEKHKRWRSSKC